MYFALGVVLFVLAVWLFRNRSDGNLPPGPKGIPLLGVAKELDLFNAHKTLSQWADKFGALFSFSVMGVRSVVINDAKLLRKAFAEDEYQNVFNDRPDTFFSEYFTHSKDVVLAHLETAIHTRKVLHKGLHFYGEGVAAFERNIAAELQRVVEELKETAGREVNPRPTVEASICMLINTLLTGDHNRLSAHVTENREQMMAFIDSANRLSAPLADTVLRAAPFLRFVPGPLRNIYLQSLSSHASVIDKYYRNQKKSYRKEKGRGMVDYFLSLEHDQAESIGSDYKLTEDHVTGIITNVIGAGVLTSTYGILWILLALMNHPDCADKAREEVIAVVGRDRYPSFSDRTNMPYTEALILEGLRYISHVPIMVPHRCTKDVQFEGYSIPKHTQVLANAFYIHHDEKVWGDPWTFRPDRFLDEDGGLVSPTHPARKAFLAFGVGKRSCVGEALAKSRLFLYISTLLQRFMLQPSKDLPPFNPLTHVEGGIVLLPPLYNCTFVPC